MIGFLCVISLMMMRSTHEASARMALHHNRIPIFRLPHFLRQTVSRAIHSTYGCILFSTRDYARLVESAERKTQQIKEPGEDVV